MKDGEDVRKMRAIAEEAFQMVRDYKGSHSGEHGDGMVRSEFHESMFGPRLVNTFAEVKGMLDPHGRFNPGKIVDPPKMDDRHFFRYPPGYRTSEPKTLLDWSAWGGFANAVEMCNNNGACRKRDAGVMCPSYRATGDEQHLTRGRANSLRLALSGQLGEDALTSDEMYETMRLCIGCKACKRECPTGVDMARMKTEFLHHYKERRGFTLQDRLVGDLPDYAPLLSRLGPLANIREWLPGGRWLAKHILGLANERPMPGWRRDAFHEIGVRGDPSGTKEVVLFPDCFNRYFEPENLRAALGLFEAMGLHIHLPKPATGRPLCCGRTFLAAGMAERAKAEAVRSLEVLSGFVKRGVPIVGLEPSCLLTFRDEVPALLGEEHAAPLASQTLLFEEFLGREDIREDLLPQLKPLTRKRALIHGHCHQKAFGLVEGVSGVLGMIPDLEVVRLETGCCGMAGAFGYAADTYEISKKIAGTELLPALADTREGDAVIAPGTSCRHQIRDLTKLDPVHPAKLLFQSLMADKDRAQVASLRDRTRET
jgi:Fe-S oxidoreductase